MIRTAWIGLIGLTLAASTAIAQENGHKAAAKGDKATEVKATCPVSGEAIDTSVFAHYKGRRVYFCCKDCVADFNKDAEKFADKIKAQWAAMPMHRVQVKCPVTGDVVNPAVFVETKNVDIYFKDEAAKQAWEKDSGKYEKALANCYTFQTTCPLSGKDINPKMSKVIDGKTVYFCCDGCPSKSDKVDMKKVEAGIKANEAAFKKAESSEHK